MFIKKLNSMISRKRIQILKFEKNINIGKMHIVFYKILKKTCVFEVFKCLQLQHIRNNFNDDF